jgi:hypothetical protein
MITFKERAVQFGGKDIDPDKVVAVEEVKSYSIGTMSCDWEYGFTVKLVGNDVIIRFPRPKSFGYPHGVKGEDYKKEVEAQRALFLLMI